MESFWSIIGRWEPLGQGVFFLIVLGGAATLFTNVAKYIAVSIRGWPPGTCYCCCEDDDED